MMRAFASFAIAIFCLSLSTALAEDPPPLPTTAPPTVIKATLLNQPGATQLELIIPQFVMEARRKVVQVDGKNVEIEYRILKPVYETKVLSLDEEVRVVDRAGNPVKTDALPALLKKKTPVLFSNESKVDPFYLQVYRDDVLIVFVHKDKD